MISSSLHAYKDAAKERVRLKAPLVFHKLIELKIVKVTIEYYGSGDSGGIESINFDRADTVSNSTFTTINVEGTLEEEIKELMYDILETRYGGWEINEGSFGTFVLEFGPAWPDYKLTHVHNANETITHTTEHEGIEDVI